MQTRMLLLAVTFWGFRVGRFGGSEPVCGESSKSLGGTRLKNEDTSRCHKRSKPKKGFLGFRSLIFGDLRRPHRDAGEGWPRGAMRAPVGTPRANGGGLQGVNERAHRGPRERVGSVLVRAHEGDLCEPCVEGRVEDTDDVLVDRSSP